MTTETADEAQALIHPGVVMEYGRIRDGVVERAEHIEIPVEFFTKVCDSVIEMLSLARNEELYRGAKAAKQFVEDLVRQGIVRQEDAHRVELMMALEISRSIERLSISARDRYRKHLPVTLRLLTPLITRRSETTS